MYLSIGKSELFYILIPYVVLINIKDERQCIHSNPSTHTYLLSYNIQICSCKKH